ncbi:hypothetical protein ACF1B0_22075 [Streptomyces anandii]|uniref:hypothetical protein n=1 Tax=Streptomyces anandii TaxID=285454 RepID=UPI0036F5D68C
MTGTEGRVTYQIEDVDGARIGEVTLHWDNPYYGANSYDESVTPAATPFPVSGFTVLHAYGEGDNAFVEFKLGSGHCDLDVDGIFFCVTSSPITVETDRFAAIWEQAAGPSWSALHGLAGDAYQARFDELVGQGYRPVQISGYGAGGDRFAAVFEQRDGPPFVAFHGLAGDAYQARFDELVGQGYRLTQVSGY